MSDVFWAAFLTGIFTVIAVLVSAIGYLIHSWMSNKADTRRRISDDVVARVIDNGLEKVYLALQRLFNIHVILTAGDPEPEFRGIISSDLLIQQISEFIANWDFPGLLMLPEAYEYFVSDCVHGLLYMTQVHADRDWDNWTEEQKSFISEMSRRVDEAVKRIIDGIGISIPRMKDIAYNCSSFQQFSKEVENDTVLHENLLVMSEAQRFLGRVGYLSHQLIWYDTIHDLEDDT